MPIFRMAWRNVWRGGRRTLVTIGAMALGLWTMILYSGLLRGYLWSMEDDVVSHEVGQVQIHAPGYLTRPTVWDSIPDAPQVVERLHAEGYGATARVLGGGLAASGDASAGVSIRGIDPVGSEEVLSIAEYIRAGRWLQPDDTEGAVIGNRLARTLGAKPGDELVVLSQGADGSMANALYTIIGVLGPLGEATDRAGVFLLADTARDLLVLEPGTAHEILVREPDGTDTAPVVAAAEAAAPGMDVQSWRQLMPMIATMVDSAQGLVVMIFGIVYIAIGILVLNAVLMAVFERIREFGVLKALGVGPGAVVAMVMLETVVQLAVAVVVGLILAVPGAWWLATHGLNIGAFAGGHMMGLTMPQVWIGQFGPEQVTSPLMVLTVIVVGATLWPAIQAARIHPVEAMRHH